MKVLHHATRPIAGQRPGTSGLRKKTAIFRQSPYLENYLQAIFNTQDFAGKTLILGGDGRAFCAEAAQVILKMAAAAGVARVIVGQGALLSTPAASHLIRQHQAAGGIILSASHNPGGESGDFGVKLNTAAGGPVPEAVSEAIYAETGRLSAYRIADLPDFDLRRLGAQAFGPLQVEVVDPVTDYLKLMEQLFDFEAISALFARGFRLRFDAMWAVTGPYAKALFEDRLGAPPGTVMRAEPRPDFGGTHPDPNPHWAKALYDDMMGPTAPDFGAASDGDGDRNMILGRGIYVSPSDSLAILAAGAEGVPAYRAGLKGIARSMPTSAAADRVAAALGVPLYETPTGWKFFGNLLEAGKITLCGEESFGTSSDHVREKDGLWAVLFWLNLLALRGQSVAAVVQDHWRRFGRNAYVRHDYEALPEATAKGLMERLAAALPGLAGQSVAGLPLRGGDVFAYHDPVDGSVSQNQGLRLFTAKGGRIVWRLSGTGTEGATLRIYFDQFTDDPADFTRPAADLVAPLVQLCEKLTDLAATTGRPGPDVVS